MTSDSTTTSSTTTSSTTTSATKAHDIVLPVDVRTIQRLLPHRYPFLLVDRITTMEPGKRITAYKNITINEPFFQGHFPSKPVMPGVLVIEAMAQTGGLLYQLTKGSDNTSGKLFYLVKIDNAKFSRMVVPGDRLEMHVEIKRHIRNMVFYQGVAQVDGKDAAYAEFLCAESQD
jgi:3-hydroxyacyl-[acyl-carrier-protein] dehydratase